MSSAVLYIMTQKGFEVLRRLTSTYPAVIERVVIGKDSNIENDFSEEIAAHSRSAGIAFDFRGAEPELRGDEYVFAISWRWLIKHPVERLIVFHDSPLPRYRGFAPLVNMLVNGEKEIGVERAVAALSAHRVQRRGAHRQPAGLVALAGDHQLGAGQVDAVQVEAD